MLTNRETQRIVLELDGKTITVKKTERFIFFEEEVHKTGFIYSRSAFQIEKIEKIQISINNIFETKSGSRGCAIEVYENTRYNKITFYSVYEKEREFEGIDFQNFNFYIKDDKKRADFVLQMKALFESI